MCGICGIYSRERLAGAALEQMTQALAHRGPDEAGYLREAPVFFGHRRLKVIDLLTGAQPMTSQDGRVSLVFNGEIYNFREIRSVLEKKGRRFKTNSDTESLLQLYEERGVDCLRELKGMFAFVLYDRRERKLLLAVDRFGKKPLYYSDSVEPFLFSSELKPLLRHPGVSKKISQKALDQYLAFEYVPAPLSMIEGILKLEAGHYLEVSESGIQKKKYWQHDFEDAEKSEEEWRQIFLSEFERSVRQRLVSDVPLGVFLSGGLDSSAVLAMMRKINPAQSIKTFSISFKEPSFDESKYSRLVSRYFKTEHFEESFSMAAMLSEHAAILNQMDEPLADASFLPTYFLSRLARRHVTVALSGDGGDELFYGYPTFQASCLGEKLDFLPSGVWKLFHRWAEALPTSMDNISFDFKVKQFLKGMRYRGFKRDQAWLGAFSDEKESAFEPLRSFEALNARDGLKKLQSFYFQFYLQGDILVKTDRASMAHSLEVRSPLLDDDLVRQMIQVPSRLQFRGGTNKYLFKKAMRGQLPEEIIDRPKKGFGIPIAHWIRQDLRREFEEIFNTRSIQKDGLFEASALQSLLQEHLSGKKDNRKQLWTVYVFQKWKQCIESPSINPL